MRLIDADALTYEILSEYGADGGTEDVNTIYGMIINAPTIDAEPIKRGTWQYYVKGNDAWAVCSECGKVSIVGGNYCPNCGAKMKGTEE